MTCQPINNQSITCPLLEIQSFEFYTYEMNRFVMFRVILRICGRERERERAETDLWSEREVSPCFVGGCSETMTSFLTSRVTTTLKSQETSACVMNRLTGRRGQVSLFTPLVFQLFKNLIQSLGPSRLSRIMWVIFNKKLNSPWLKQHAEQSYMFFDLIIESRFHLNMRLPFAISLSKWWCLLW